MPEKTSKALFAIVVGLSTVALLSAGCFRNTAAPQDVEETDPYPARSHPDSVLRKLEMAYEAMDLAAYLDCLADTFAFHLLPEDINDPNGDLPSWWGKSCEDSVHTGMFGLSGGISADSIKVGMENETADFDPGATGDVHDDRWTYEEDVSVRFHIGEWVYLVNNGQMFVFAVEPGREDTLWQIVDWTELELWDARGSWCSWGSVKALWR